MSKEAREMELVHIAILDQARSKLQELAHAQREHERRVVSVLVSMLDQLGYGEVVELIDRAYPDWCRKV